ncbi:substrate-binding periplasmic protein [Pigmentibacter ruber]|uniref:substrate-binding periplasmic protein n=1 Tax=Pigmentibacter ruber TaxID=2683196 RepID=UPI00131AC847|nr:transporter substrate-binding domain-containing protein [Pigmentibacter ruber]
MKFIFSIYLFIFFTIIYNNSVFASSATLTMHVRDRYPEISIENNTITGPLIDIIKEAGKSIDVKIELIEAPFTRTLIDLENGKVDLCPRLSLTTERKNFVYFLGPILSYKKIVNFIVPKGNKNLISKYEDLLKYQIAVKRGTFYFENFNNNEKIEKLYYKDDENMSLMFANKRFKVMAIRDLLSLKKYFKKINFNEYEIANYKHEEIEEIFYAMSKKSAKLEYKDKLNFILNKMRTDCTIKKIYNNYNIKTD